MSGGLIFAGFTVQNIHGLGNIKKELEGGRVVPGLGKKNFPQFLASLPFSLTDLGLRVELEDSALASYG